MIVLLRYSLTFLAIVSLPFAGLGQNIFSEKQLDVPKAFLPYDVPYTFALADKEFVQLTELRSNTLKLGRYDQYFFEQWETNIEFSSDISAPQMYLRGDTIFIYCFTAFRDEGATLMNIRLFDLSNGKEMPGNNYKLQMVANKEYDPKISFSEGKSKFVIYNYLAQHEEEEKATFTVFQTGNPNAISEYYLEAESTLSSGLSEIHLSDNGDIFFIAISPGDYKANSYFMSHKFQEVNEISNNFFFERPIDGFSEIDILRQGVSSYFVSFTSNFENELVGFNVAGYNVILKTVMYSYNQNLRKDEIEKVYTNYYTPVTNQKKKFLQVPKKLENFRLVKSVTNPEKDVILIFEDTEIPKDYFESGSNMTWKPRIKIDKNYSGGDILLFCFTAGGELIWQKCIQKTQISQASGLGLSFIEYVENENMHLLIHESSDGGSFYVMTINMLDGSLVNTINLIPDKKFEFTKKYSCWLDGKSILLCGIAPGNIYKRSLMLVEF